MIIKYILIFLILFVIFGLNVLIKCLLFGYKDKNVTIQKFLTFIIYCSLFLFITSPLWLITLILLI